MIRLKDVTKIYEGSDYKTTALDNINLTVNAGDFLAIMGPSGSGKTTLLNIIGCMDSPTEGQYLLGEEDVSGYSSKRLTELRKNHISFVFQNFALMQDYTIYENIEVPLLAKNKKRIDRKKIIEEQMDLLGISDLGNKLPSQVSGGQQQRVAIARALAAENPVILADEPTGALDQRTSRELMEVFSKLHANGKTIILITHDPKVAEYAERLMYIEDGKIYQEALKRQ